MGEPIDTFPVQGTLSFGETAIPSESWAYSNYGP